MKKFVVLTLVLGMASLASATLSLTTTGEITLMPSDELVLGIVADDVTAASIGGWILVQGDTGILAADQPTLWEQSTANNMDPAIVAEYAPILESDLGYPGVTDIIEWDIKDTVDPFDPIPNDMVIGNLIFHCEGIGDVVLTLMDLDLNVFSTLTIHQIPEPMTMALLGLGGLFLRRRK